ncbi:MAG: glycosyltransferase family 4 protein [Oscillatoriales cyanobacterium C42_A2020_001]|nr:glycosyltransferase family 4 protein [Leptolyngbyaceae cyanobacterium C42_A2020_001]
MRILHILNDIRELGNGIINVAVDLACSQAEQGYEVSVASAGGEYEALLAKYGVKHFYLDQQRRPMQLWQAAHRYRQIIQTVQPDIVHAHMMTGVVLARLFRLNCSYILVSTVHNEFQASSILMGIADRVIAVSHAVASSMAKRGVPQNKLRVVHNGTIGSPRLRRFHTTDIPALHRPAITTVAGMTERKGIADLIAAFIQIAPRFPMAHLYLVGDGFDMAKFRQQAQASVVGDRIHFEGFQPNPVRYLHSTDVFVLASRREPFGLVLAEAREVGCAIVASNVDGIPEALDQGEAGILVPPLDQRAIATALQTLLEQPQELCHWQQQAQRNLDWLSVNRMSRETLGVYREVVGVPQGLPG